MRKIAFCFDLDGTLTKKEILPLLAKELNIAEEMEMLTIATLKGIIPFSNSFKLRCLLLKDLFICKAQHIIANIALNDQIISFIQSNINNCFIITGNAEVWLKKLIEKIGCPAFCTTVHYKGNKIIKVKEIINKGEIVKRIRRTFNYIVAVGDGAGDIGMFEQADLKIAFGGVHEPPTSLTSLSDFIIYSEEELHHLLNKIKYEYIL
jgi:phosphoserine phosphatase